MKKQAYFLAFAAIVGFAACKKNDSPNPTPTPTVAKVKFTNASVGSDSVRVYLNDTMFQAANKIGLLASTGYLSVNQGSSQKVSIKTASTNVTLNSVITSFTANNSYSVFAGGTVTSTDVIAISDDLAAPAAGKFKVRFVNLSSETLSPDVYIGSTKIDSSVNYMDHTGFAELTAGAMNVKVLDPANIPNSPSDLSSYNFVSGKIYTIILSGVLGGSSGAELKLSAITNN